MNMRLIVLWTCLCIAACHGDSPLPGYELHGRTMGTTFNISVIDPPSGVDLDALQATLVAELEHIEAIASTYRPESDISAFNAAGSTGWIQVSPEFCAMTESAQAVSAVTGGAFDITVGPLVNLWGFGPDAMRQDVPAPDDVAAVMALVGNDKLQADCEQSRLRKSVAGLRIDLSGWAKGYAVDALAEILDRQRLQNYLIEVGGELRLRGHNAGGQKFAIAIDNPDSTAAKVYRVVKLSDVAVATSGDYRNFYEHGGRRYSHTIDPRTGRPVEHSLSAVTVLDRSTAFADALATALLVLGPEKGPAFAEEREIASLFLIRRDGGITEYATPRFLEITGS